MDQSRDVIPEGWQTTTLNRVVKDSRQSVDPRDFPAEIFEYYSIPAYQSTGTPIQERGSAIGSQKLLVDPGTVLFGKLNPRVPKVWRVSGPSERRKIASTEFIPLNPIEGQIDGDFLYFLSWSDSVMGSATGLVSGSTPSRQRVDPRSFLALPILLPSLNEQRAIASVLRALREADDATKKVVAAIRGLKRALMRQLFTYGSVPVADSDQVALHETNAGRIPDGWRAELLGSVARVKTSYPSFAEIPQLDSGRENDISVLALKVSDLNLAGNEKYITRSNTQLRVADRAWAEKRLLPANSLVFPKRGAAIATNKKRLTTTLTLLDPNLIGVQPGDELSSEFLYYFFEQLDLRSLSDNTTIPQLNKHNVDAVFIPLPSRAEQDAIALALAALDRKLQEEEDRSVLLGRLFAATLAELMTGQRRVSTLEAA